MNTFTTTLTVLRRIERVCLVVPMAVLIIFVFLQIILRTMGFPGFPWLDELSRYILIFCTFLGISIAIDTDSHPKMTALLVAVPRPANLSLKMVGDVFCAAACFFIAYYGYVQITKQFSSGAISSTLTIPMYVPYLIIPVGLFTSGIRYIISLIKNAFLLSVKGDTARKLEGGEGA